MARWWVAVLMVGAGATAFEVAARVEDLLRYGTPLLSPYRSQSDLAMRDALGMHGRPGARFQKWILNNLGTRGPDAPPTPAAGVRRVVTVGASETFGLYESPGHEFPRQLADSLGAGYDVLNAAMPGMSLPTVTQDVTLRVAGFRPSFVLLYPTPVQYLTEALPRAALPDSAPGAGALPHGLALTPRAVDRIRDQVKGMLPHAVATALRERDIAAARAAMGGAVFISTPPERLVAFEHDLRRFVGAVRAVGAEPVLATHADAFDGAGAPDATLLTTWVRQYPRADGTTILAFEAEAAAVVGRVAADSGVAVAEVRQALAGAGHASFADYAHFTDAGAARVAGTMARTIRADAVAAR